MAKLTINFDASNLNELHTKRWNQLIGLLESDALYVDDHRYGMEPSKFPFRTLVVYMHYDAVEICPFFSNEPYFSINPLRGKDGVLHLIRESCGPTIIREGAAETQLNSMVEKGQIAGYIKLN